MKDISKVTIALDAVTVHMPTDLWRPKFFVGGQCLDQGNTSVSSGGKRAIPPGTPFEVDAKEAASMLRRFSGQIISDHPPEAVVAAKRAYEDAQVPRSARNSDTVGSLV